MGNTSIIKLSKANIENNWNFLRQLYPEQRISAVVKGNAYGHDIEAYVPVLCELGVDHFSVFNAHEAYRVLEAVSPQAEIMIMGHIPDDDMRWAIEQEIQFYVFNLERLNKALYLSKELKRKAKIHLEIETGMYRTGLTISELDDALEIIKNNRDYLHFSGICTHLAGAENLSNLLRIAPQKERFHQALKRIDSHKVRPDLRHVCCSAAALRYPEMHFDLLRIGIMQYGFWPNTETYVEFASKNHLSTSPLKRVMSWETEVMALKSVPADAYVGYGQSYYTQDEMKLAIVPIGYAYGFARELSNAGKALIRGREVPVIGTINMNCLTLDVSALPKVNIGDLVTLVGHNGDREISVASFSELSNVLNYEMLTRLPEHIPREVE